MASTKTNTLTLRVSEDAWRGDAQFVVKVDGQQIGGVQTAKASHSAGQWQDITLSGTFADPASVQITFLNDAYGGTASTDRNLYVQSLSLNGQTFRGEAASNGAGSTIEHAAALLSSGTLTFDTTPHPDALTLRVSEDAWRGDAHFIVLVDGHQVGNVQSVTAAHGAGQWQDITVSGAFGTPKSVQVQFLNDAWGGTADTDRNLYVQSLTLNGQTFKGEDAANGAGQTIDHAAALLSNGTLKFDLTHAPATTAATAPLVAPAAHVSLLGVNLAGADFAANKSAAVLGTDYTYPTHQEIDYYAAKGLNVVRLPFLWERLQPTMNGPLSARELSHVDDVVNYAASKGLKVVLDAHDYGYGYGHMIGSPETPVGAFADFWGKMAGHFASQGNVLFGLMNEPHDQTAVQWLGAANAAIAAIRAAGATGQEILVPGTHWDGAWTWTTSDNAAVIGGGIHDPAHNYAIDVHQYLDADGSGTHLNVVSPQVGAERLAAITQWAEQSGQRLFLSEFGVAQDATSLAAMNGMLTYMDAHAKVWQGATYWAGGAWWGDYMYAIEPTGIGTSHTVDKPQMNVLTMHT